MRVFYGLLLGVLCLNPGLWAGNLSGKLAKPVWESGQVTLLSGEVLLGEIRYDLNENIVILRQLNRMRAFSAHSVQSFTVASSMPRRYFALPYRPPGGPELMMFFQLVFDEQFTLFVREREVNQAAIRSAKFPVSQYPGQAESEMLMAFQYYVYLPDGSFRELTTSRKVLCQLFALGKTGNSVLNRFIVEHNINFTKQPDIIKLVHHFLNPETDAFSD